MATLAPFDRSWTVLLTTYKRDGTPVATPVNVAVEGDHAYFRSYDKAWKTKRLAHNPDVEIAPSSVRGRPRGPALRARARLLDGEEAQHARRVIAGRHPVFQRLVVPLAHKTARYTTMHYELSVLGPALAGRE
jgi:PPOX class probable F420-dependent enzyme